MNCELREWNYGSQNVYELYDDFMRFCIVVFVHHIVYVACAPCERIMMILS
jgi:hypothetical protein